MGSYSVPESIRQYKPKGTMVKRISDHYYVYEYSNYTDENGKRHTRMGRLIGSIREGVGFIPNDAYLCDSGISCVDFGEYAVTFANSKKTFSLLEECFHPQDAVTLYIAAMICFIQGFTNPSDMHLYYEMSVLSLRFPALKLDCNVLLDLYDALGRRGTNVLKMEQKLLEGSSHQIMIDRHVINRESAQHDLPKEGGIFQESDGAGTSLLMAYDVHSGIPLLSIIENEQAADTVSIRGFMEQTKCKDMLFIVGREFYSAENIRLFSENGNAYIMPFGKNLKTCKEDVFNLHLQDHFLYQNGKKSSVIGYRDEMIDGYRVLAFRDLNEFAEKQKEFLGRTASGEKGYSAEDLERNSRYGGFIVLQTSLLKETPEEIYTLYKKPSSIETFYEYFKNKAGYNCLSADDYGQTQGLAFLMLVSALIHQEVTAAVAGIKDTNLSSCLLNASMVKAYMNAGKWRVCNCGKEQKELFRQLNTPLTVELE